MALLQQQAVLMVAAVKGNALHRLVVAPQRLVQGKVPLKHPVQGETLL
jgi:hypothetical protein